MSTTYGPTPASDRDVEAAFYAGDSALEAAESAPGDAGAPQAADAAVSSYVAASRSAERASVYGPDVATRADADRSTMRSAATLADPAASWDDRQTALESEAAAHESYWQIHGHPAYAEHSAREGLVREHAGRGLAILGAEHQAQAGDFEAGQ